MTVTNVTTTTVRDLNGNTEYMFRVSGISGDEINGPPDVTDAYGRRRFSSDALIGSHLSINSHTLDTDINFAHFDSNSTQNHGSIDSRSSFGPSGIHGEGHYGLIFKGDASIANCNASSSCCDAIEEDGSCTVGSYSCIPLLEMDSISTMDKLQDLPSGGKSVGKVTSKTDFHPFHYRKCGPELRLTGSSRKRVGAAWYPRQVDVGEGFDTYFSFRISNPSYRCNNLEGVHTRCRSRGADGFAFVIQNFNEQVLGSDGHKIGYDIPNSVAIEFDTYYNFEEMEPYENHISIHTRGSNSSLLNNPHQTYSLGSTTTIPDLTDGILNARIVYRPQFDFESVIHPSFDATPYFLKEHTKHNDGIIGLGMMYIYISRTNAEDLQSQSSWVDVEPSLTIPIKLSSILALRHGRKAWVGFTSATGVDSWQTHDILRWSFTSLRLDGDEQ